jgi:hypothetical protein
MCTYENRLGKWKFIYLFLDLKYCFVYSQVFIVLLITYLLSFNDLKGVYRLLIYDTYYYFLLIL